MNWPFVVSSHSICTVWTSLTWPCSSPIKFLGGREINARVIAEFRRRFFLAVIELVNLGPFRPGIVLGAVHAADCGRISTCTRLLQPWRIEVPTQSVPVSPPPMTMTSLPSAEMKLPFLCWSSRLLVLAVRNSIAKWTPFEMAAFDRQIARLGRAGAENHGVKFLQKLFRRIIFADFGIGEELDAFGFQQIECGAARLLPCRASCSGCRT